MDIKNVIFGTAGIVLIALASVLMPILGVLLAGVPIILMFLKEKGSVHDSIVTLIVSSVMIHFVFGIFSALFIGIYGLLNTAILIYTQRYKVKALKSQILLGISVLLSFTFVLYLLNMGTNLHISEFFKESFFSSEEMIDSMGLLDSSDMDMNILVNQILTIIPFIMILISMVNGLIIYHGNRLMMKKINQPVVDMVKFSYFKLPMHFVYGVTFILLLSYLAGFMDLIDFNTISLNIVLILIYVFAFQGSAILFYYLDKRNINDFIKGLILFLLILFQAIFLLSIVGWLDMIFDFRRIKNENAE